MGRIHRRATVVPGRTGDGAAAAWRCVEEHRGKTNYRETLINLGDLSEPIATGPLLGTVPGRNPSRARTRLAPCSAASAHGDLYRNLMWSFISSRELSQ